MPFIEQVIPISLDYVFDIAQSISAHKDSENDVAMIGATLHAAAFFAACNAIRTRKEDQRPLTREDIAIMREDCQRIFNKAFDQFLKTIDPNDVSRAH